jgi:hypothetical protein
MTHKPETQGNEFHLGGLLRTERRFVPLRLDDVTIIGSLARILYVNCQPDEGASWGRVPSIAYIL